MNIDHFEFDRDNFEDAADKPAKIKGSVTMNLVDINDRSTLWDDEVTSGDWDNWRGAAGLTVKEEIAEREQREQVGGTHYQTVIQPIDFIMKNNLGFCEGNVIKYVTRHRNKNGAEDIKKAIQYLQFILENEYGIE